MEKPFINKLGQEYLFLKVPDTESFAILGDIINNEPIDVLYMKKIDWFIALPKIERNKTWIALVLVRDIVEEVAKEVVDNFSVTRLNQFGYKDYIQSDNHCDFFTFKTAMESLKSLVQSLGFKEDDNVMILVKI